MQRSEGCRPKQKEGGGGKWQAPFTAMLDLSSYRATAAPIVEYAKQVWWAMPRQEAADQDFDLSCLNRMWHDLQMSPPSCWDDVAGPLGAALQSMARIGWTWISAFSFKDRQKVTRTFTENSAAAVAALVRRDYRAKFEEAIQLKLGTSAAPDLVCPATLLRTEELSPLEKGCLRSFLIKSV